MFVRLSKSTASGKFNHVAVIVVAVIVVVIVVVVAVIVVVVVPISALVLALIIVIVVVAAAVVAVFVSSLVKFKIETVWLTNAGLHTPNDKTTATRTR